MRYLATTGFAVGLILSCSDHHDDDGGADGSPDNTGMICDAPDECYEGIDHEDLAGDVICLDDVDDGYCTHTCETDDDCCAVDGECETDHPQVCAPFQSNSQKYCFLSCESDVVGEDDENEYCQEHAHSSFICRSTGGGSQNRKVCVREG